MFLLLACWIGEPQRAAWETAHAPPTDTDTDTDADTDTDEDDRDGDGFRNRQDECPDEADIGYGTDIFGCPYEYDPDTLERAFVLAATGNAEVGCRYYDADEDFFLGPVEWTQRFYVPFGGVTTPSDEADGHVDIDYVQEDTVLTTLDALGYTLRSDSTRYSHFLVTASSTPGADQISAIGGGRRWDIGYTVAGDIFDDVPIDGFPDMATLLGEVRDGWETVDIGTQLYLPEYSCTWDIGRGETTYQVTNLWVED